MGYQLLNISCQFCRYVLCALLSLIFISTAGCTQFRKLTYPQDFVYLDQSQVQTSMLRMSLAMRRIDETLIGQNQPSSADQQRVIDDLNTIDEITDKLGSGNQVTNHLIIDQHIDQFKREVRNALRTATSEPPSFYAAGRLSASCIGCHRYRR
ncbi:MAG: hypothetical protein GY763_03930 [Gammaproteobacteria bacterium]|nr:hypothetical protein [Gammaproteobacteria bacterium]